MNKINATIKHKCECSTLTSRVGALRISDSEPELASTPHLQNSLKQSTVLQGFCFLKRPALSRSVTWYQETSRRNFPSRGRSRL